MKKIILLCFLLCSFLVFSQQTINTTWKSQVNSIFQGLDKSKVPHAVLLDFAMEFTNVPAYNGVLTDSTSIDISAFGNIYKTVFLGKVTSDTQYFPKMETFATTWSQHRSSFNQEEQNTIVLAGLFYNYSRFRADALSANKIAVSNNKYFDKFISGVWQNPYETKQTIAFVPAINDYNKRSFDVVLPQNLLLSNSASTIFKIEIDFNDGAGYQIVTYGQKLNVSYSENGNFDWVFKTTLTNGSILYSKTKIKINDPTSVTEVLQRPTNFQNNVFIAGPNSPFSGSFQGAYLRIDYAPSSNGKIVKPFIVAEGFDPGSILYPEKLGGDRTLNDDFVTDIFSSGNQLRSLLEFDSTQEYDIIYIDWQNGTNDIKHNSAVLRNVLAWVNVAKIESGSPHKNVLMGQSMGGLIARYCLAKMEQDNVNHDVRLFIAHDSPMQGANVPISTQFLSRHIYDEYVETPILYGVFEVVIPTLLNFADLLTNGLLDVAFPTPADYLTLQDTPAALQLNYDYVDNLSNPTKAVHNLWQQEFDAMGYPQLSRNIAISNGNECATNHGFTPGAKFINLHDTHNPDFFGDLLHIVLTPLIGAIISDIDLILVGLLPGSSKYYFDFDVYSNPSLTATLRTSYKGRIRYEKKFLWIAKITIDLMDRTKNVPAGYFPYDSYAGGSFDVRTVTSLVADYLPSGIYLNPKYGFIPVVSALDIKRNNGAPIASDFLKKYAGGSTPETALTSGFDSFIVGITNNGSLNDKHITFQVRNGNWLAQELSVNQGNPVYPDPKDCTFICSDKQIAGPTTICTTAAYTLPIGADTISWSVTPANALSI